MDNQGGAREGGGGGRVRNHKQPRRGRMNHQQLPAGDKPCTATRILIREAHPGSRKTSLGLWFGCISLAPRKTPWSTLVYDARCTLNYSWARRVGRAKVRPSQLAAGAAPNSPTRRLPLLGRGHNDRTHQKAGHVRKAAADMFTHHTYHMYATPSRPCNLPLSPVHQQTRKQFALGKALAIQAHVDSQRKLVDPPVPLSLKTFGWGVGRRGIERRLNAAHGV
ncbi:hypothetical protein LX32DRAFT_5572 [Colletotrichum zoysiae]|uniref:Uncharacterized protein n=1 Tax=Colletotrichum zoysiae TaxID=1216348 RepID=A0AAD9HRK4_9PEZI|nr:hypothetical protein LX32DRAFT_5572 [Colletotrichum zoysiae]